MTALPTKRGQKLSINKIRLMARIKNGGGKPVVSQAHPSLSLLRQSLDRR